ncbi:MAG: PAS domain S-box protein [Clostridiaceae bacterium]|nr:PAS domain S-box protein [Clostridiaceae bacterium]
MVFNYLIIHSLRVSLIVLLSVFFIVMLMVFFLDRKVYLGMWAGGLSLFLTNIILLMSVNHGYGNEFIILLQRIFSSLGAFIMAEGCMKLLNKKINCSILVFLCLNIIVAANYALGLMPIRFVLFIHFTFLTSVNVYIAIELIRSKKPIIFNKYVLGFAFLAWGMSYAVKGIVFIIKPQFRLWGVVTTLIITLFFLIYTIFAFYRHKTNLLYEKEMCFDDIFNYSAIGMAVVGVDGSIMRGNQSLSKILGYSCTELKGLYSKDITYEEDRNMTLKGVEELLLEQKNSFQVEKRYYNKNGHVVWVIVNISLIRDKKQKPLYFVLQVQDVTSYKTLQNELIKSNEKYKTLLNSYDNSIEVLDKEYRYVVANQHVVDTINHQTNRNFTLSTIIGQKFKDIYPTIYNSEMFKIYKYVMNTRKSRHDIVEYTNSKGRTEWYELNITPSPEGILVIANDITDRVKDHQIMKETIELDRLRTEFFANLSHEFRTPLNIILSSNKMLLDAVNNQEGLTKDYAVKYLRASKQNCYRLLRLINNIMDITKFDSGFLHSNLQCWNIINLVEEIAQSIVEYAKNKNIGMIFDTDVEEKYIMCDADKIERVMLNLLSNAIKFTHDGGTIEVKIFDKNDSIEIIVKDNGICIPENKLNLIFDRFRQVDKSLTRNQEGSGIGLSLAKVFVEMHKGTIEVFSTKGKGTTFLVKLPTNNSCILDEIAISKQICDSKIEKVNVEFSDIYF